MSGCQLMGANMDSGYDQFTHWAQGHAGGPVQQRERFTRNAPRLVWFPSPGGMDEARCWLSTRAALTVRSLHAGRVSLTTPTPSLSAFACGVKQSCVFRLGWVL